ncbi:Uncharacterized protein OBRU01_13293, partial [Operophtera brumata]
MWKKSGAWFYKSLPKYILPERRTTGRYYETELASVHAPSFSRQPSNTDSRKSVGSPHRPLGPLKRTGSKGSAYSLRSVRKDAKPPTQAERAPAIPDAGFGTLEIRLAYGCDEMGSAVVALRECAKSPSQLRLALSSSSGAEPVGPRILLALCYNTKRRALVHKSSIKWRNLNPVWNEEFPFETRPTELSRQNLTLTVWDKDYGKPNDFLGSLVLGSSSKGRRLKHWMDCIKFPDHKHEQWHSLTDTQHL